MNFDSKDYDRVRELARPTDMLTPADRNNWLESWELAFIKRCPLSGFFNRSGESGCLYLARDGLPTLHCDGEQDRIWILAARTQETALDLKSDTLEGVYLAQGWLQAFSAWTDLCRVELQALRRQARAVTGAGPVHALGVLALDDIMDWLRVWGSLARDLSGYTQPHYFWHQLLEGDLHRTASGFSAVRKGKS